MSDVCGHRLWLAKGCNWKDNKLKSKPGLDGVDLEQPMLSVVSKSKKVERKKMESGES